MTYRDSNVGSCDHCADTDAFIVGQDSDGNYCDKCEAIYQPEPKSEILWGLIALIAFVSIVVAPWLAEGK